MLLTKRNPWRFQPQYPVKLNPKFGNPDMWLPSIGASNLRDGGGALTINATYGTKSNGPYGQTFARVGADFNIAMTLPAGGTYNSILIYVDKRTSTAPYLFGAVSGNQLGGGIGSVITFYVASSLRITGALLLELGSVVFGQWRNADYVLCHKNSKGLEFLTNTAVFGDASPTQWGYNSNDSVYLIARWRDERLDNDTIKSIVSDPLQLFQSHASLIFLPSAGIPPPGEFFSPFPTFRPGL